MKLIKLYTILTFYIPIAFVLYEYYDYNNLTTLFFMLLHFICLIGVLYRLFYKDIISYSILITHLLLLFLNFYVLEFSFYFQIGLFILTLLEIYIIRLNKRQLKYYKVISYQLKVNHPFLLNVSYILYGIYCYIGFMLSKPDFKVYFEHIEDALTIVLYPYFIIILLLILLKYDSKTDEMNTLRQYKNNHLITKIIRRNILINILTIIFIMYI